ncbi:ABC transporter substrate-binding protein [Pseudacidovorax sp. RU35E]|uniref:ABC transporter substrate-binding protein n=1 Tax=Pseudacidovorax sp. RU35E TaxID=1907403 RepID=UPI0009562A8D|nr:ABC transporter substrate-binding protein [Pseudacidovorax sp. RU35E]SIR32403.1 peptide/nickel transport system substrate-binding protein [Pseudacidovorax sp. RU35E]
MHTPNPSAARPVSRRALSKWAACAAMLVVTAGTALPAVAQSTTLKIIPTTNMTVLDPIWTTAYISRNFGYMIYDTLFGTDAQGRIQPQMVGKWSVSKDNKTWTFQLRDGLEFHDGKPVTSEDVVASLKRWASRDTFGGQLAKAIDKYDTPDAKTFVIQLKEPFGLVTEALGKPSSNVPFIMPKRVADTPGDVQVKETIGSGPYIFKADEFRPGEKAVFLKNTKYKPRAEAPSGTAGGKNVYVDRVEWLFIRDAQTQLNALLNGEADILEQPAFEQYATLRSNPNIELVDAQPAGNQFILRFNFLHAPFDNEKVRRAAMLALGQEAFLRTQVGTPGLTRYCKSMFPCGTLYESDKTGEYTGIANPQKAKALLAEAGYKGEPVVLMRPSDNGTIGKLPLVAKQQLEQAGFKVDMQNMDWQTLVARRAKKDAPSAGGWSIFMTSWTASDILNPLTMAMMNATGDKGWFGWQDDPKLEAIKKQFIAATTDAEKKKLAEAAQLQAFQSVTHVPVGQYNQPAAVRKGVSGLVPAGAQVYWNIRKQ